jgi:CHAD domain-containing protein
MPPKVDEGFCVFGAVSIHRHMQALMGEIEGVRAAEDIEFVHRMRVATRRLRSALPIFKSCFGTKEYQGWLKQIKAITRALGAARDTDVQIALLEEYAADLTVPVHQHGIRRLLLRLKQKRDSLQPPILKALDGLQEKGTLQAMGERLAPLVERKDQVYLYTPYMYLSGYNHISQRLQDLFAYEPYVDQPDCVAELHAMRIAAKQLRYTLEVFSPLYPGELKSNLQVVRKCQEMLGDIHDCDVWLTLLPAFTEQEYRLTLEFYGHGRYFRRLLPGLQAFGENRKRARDRQYAAFVAYWQKNRLDNSWQSLLDSIRIPFHLGEPPAPQPSANAGISPGANPETSPETNSGATPGTNPVGTNPVGTNPVTEVKADRKRNRKEKVG